MINRVPLILIWSRIGIGILCMFLATKGVNFGLWICALMILGLLTDIFDGIVARKLNVSSVSLRKLDSIVDRFFWLMIFASCYILYPDYISTILPFVGLILLAEASVFVISFLRFGKAPSPHNLMSKVWGISVAIAFAVILLTGSSQNAFFAMFGMAILSRLDSALIYMILSKWDHDIPSFYHAILLRKGKTIARNDLFNG